MKIKIILATIICFIISLNSFGLPEDNKQPLIIKSKSFEIDYTKNFALYSGNVKLNQGTRNLNSDKLYIYFSKDTQLKQNKKTNITKIVAVSLNNSVEYTEKLEKNEGKIFAQAKIITLTPNQSLLTLEQKATIEQNGRRLTSDLLHYNYKTEIAYTPKLDKKRTKVTLG